MAVAGNGTPSTPTAEYETVSIASFSLGRDIKVQATIESLKESIPAISGQKPRAKLVIKNLSSGRVIHEEECGDSTVSDPGFWIDRGTALVMTTKGGSGDGIRVYEVTQSDARIVLTQSYRAAVIMMPNDELGDDVGFLIVDAEHATDPLEVRRYQYSREKKQFVVTGKASFSQLMGAFKAQFKKGSE